MISVSYSNGTALIFNVDDWFELRSKYRIVGECIGNSRISPQALPVLLRPEEVNLLVRKEIVNVVEWNDLKTTPSSIDRAHFERKTKQLYEEQKLVHSEGKRKLIETYATQIIEGKKKRDNNVTAQEAIQFELNKEDDQTLSEDNIVFPIYTQHPDSLRGYATSIPLTRILESTTQLKCAVYEDLWNKGYYVSSALKFGGDFLVYFGDPVTFHAMYIVKCVEHIEKEQNVTELIAYGRLGNSVCKKYVLASFNSENDQTITYITISYCT